MKYAVFDLETTGFKAGTDAITEIAWLVFEDGAFVCQESRLILPSVPVPAEVQALTGITDELLQAEGVPLADALAEFLEQTGNLSLIGHNVLGFDAGFVEAACKAVGIEPPGRDRYLDTAALYKARALGIREFWRTGEHHRWAAMVLANRVKGMRFSLTHCCEDFGLTRVSEDGTVQLCDLADPPQWTNIRAHRALSDVLMSWRLYERLTAPAELARGTALPF